MRKSNCKDCLFNEKSRRTMKMKNPTLHKQCPYCGKKFKTKSPAKKYCDKCIEKGFHWLHETIGKTNGWDKRVA